MNRQNQWLFEAPLTYPIAKSEMELPDFMTEFTGGGKPIKVNWQPLKNFDISNNSPAQDVVSRETKGVFIIYKNGQAVYVGAGGVDPKRRGGSIYQELNQYARSLRIGSKKSDRFQVRIGLLIDRVTPQRIKIVENLTIHDINKQLRQQKKRVLANRKDLKPFQVKRQTKIVHSANAPANIPPHLARNTRKRRVSQTLRRRTPYEAEGQWLFEAPLM